MGTHENDQFIAVRSSQVHYYQETPLYQKSLHDEFLIYKEQGVELSPQRVISARYPQLYIHNKHRLIALREAQAVYADKFIKGVRNKDQVYVRNIFAELVRDLLSEARVLVLHGMLTTASQSIERLLHDYAGEIIKLVTPVNELDYGSALHSVNVMALSLSFCRCLALDEETTKDIGLCGLLHDIGKAKVSTDILYADRHLSQDEFNIIKQHPLEGQKILAEGGLSLNVQQGTLEHHEKLNGQGYPGNKGEDLSFFGRIISFIDCYEALTCDDRPYRRKLDPHAALNLIKKEMEQGSFDHYIFKEFVGCLKTH